MGGACSAFELQWLHFEYMIIRIFGNPYMTPVDFFKSMADSTRMDSVLLIHAEGELCVCELVDLLQLSQPKISRHLAQLRSLGVLKDERRDQWVYYSIHPNLPAWAKLCLDATAESEASRIKSMTRAWKRNSCA
jgi:DNA-binding transcriptional ArsR family regulator